MLLNWKITIEEKSEKFNRLGNFGESFLGDVDDELSEIQVTK